MARRRRKISGFLLLLLLFIIAVTVTLTMPILNISSVTVTGNERVTKEEIEATGAFPIGKNIYRISVKKAKEQIEAIPYIKSAEVKRKFPARISVSVTERAEAAAVVCPGGYAVIDKEGRVLRLSPEEEPMCIVSGDRVETATPGQTITMEDGRFLENLTKLLYELEKTDMKVSIKRIWNFPSLRQRTSSASFRIFKCLLIAGADISKCSAILVAVIGSCFRRFRISRRDGSDNARMVSCKLIHSQPFV